MTDWSAQWIAPVESDDLPARQRPVHQLAGVVHLDGEVASAQLCATAHGIYEAFVNGTRVGDIELTPGWTAYRSHLQMQTFDVTDLLATGTNVIGALLSDGWWRGQNGVARRVDDYGTTTALFVQLDVTFADRRIASFGTDASWRSTPSHIMRADLIAGEVRACTPSQALAVLDDHLATLFGQPAATAEAARLADALADRQDDLRHSP